MLRHSHIVYITGRHGVVRMCNCNDLTQRALSYTAREGTF